MAAEGQKDAAKDEVDAGASICGRALLLEFAEAFLDSREVEVNA